MAPVRKRHIETSLLKYPAWLETSIYLYPDAAYARTGGSGETVYFRWLTSAMRKIPKYYIHTCILSISNSIS